MLSAGQGVWSDEQVDSFPHGVQGIIMFVLGLDNFMSKEAVDSFVDYVSGILFASKQT